MTCVTIGTSILFIVPNVMTAFTIISALTSILCVFTFMLIILSYIGYRKKFPELHLQSKFKMPGGLVMAWLTMLFLVFTIVILALDHDTLIALGLSPVWFIGLLIAYRYKKKKMLELDILKASRADYV